MDLLLGQIIKQARVRKKLTLKEVAEIIGVDTSTLAKIEKNQRFPNKGIIDKISVCLNLDINNLKNNDLCDRIIYKISSEDNPEEILRLAEKKLKYLHKK